MDKNIIEHACVNDMCGENVRLEWDKRQHVCQCGMRYRYLPTGGATAKASRKKGTDWLKDNRHRAERK